MLEACGQQAFIYAYFTYKQDNDELIDFLLVSFWQLVGRHFSISDAASRDYDESPMTQKEIEQAVIESQVTSFT